MLKESNYKLIISNDGLSVIVNQKGKFIGIVTLLTATIGDVLSFKLKNEPACYVPYYIQKKCVGMLLPKNTLVLNKTINCSFGGIRFIAGVLYNCHCNDNKQIYVEKPNSTSIVTTTDLKNIRYHNIIN